MDGVRASTDAGPWLSTAMRPEIVRRSLRVAALVGTVLVAINYTDRALTGTLAAFDWVKMAITYAVPYCVATFAAVQTLRQPRAAGGVVSTSSSDHS